MHAEPVRGALLEDHRPDRSSSIDHGALSHGTSTPIIHCRNRHEFHLIRWSNDLSGRAPESAPCLIFDLCKSNDINADGAVNRDNRPRRPDSSGCASWSGSLFRPGPICLGVRHAGTECRIRRALGDCIVRGGSCGSTESSSAVLSRKRDHSVDVGGRRYCHLGPRSCLLTGYSSS